MLIVFRDNLYIHFKATRYSSKTEYINIRYVIIESIKPEIPDINVI